MSSVMAPRAMLNNTCAVVIAPEGTAAPRPGTNSGAHQELVAEERVERRGQGDAAVGPAAGLHQGGPDPGPGQGRPVEGVDVVDLPVLAAPVADVGPAGLGVGEPRHRRHLEPGVDPGGVDLE